MASRKLQGIVGDNNAGAGIVGDLVSDPPFPVGPPPENIRVISGAEPFPSEPNRATVETDREQRQVRNTNPGRPGGESGERGAVPKLPNVLNSFASYSIVQTLSVLDKQELADPDNTYRANGPKYPILRSGGIGDESVRTSYEQDLGIKTEYFIEDLEVDAVMAPTPNTKQTNATLFRFKVIEPYSMGMFFETIANAVARTGDGRSSYIEAPFMLTIEFIGYTDEGRQQPEQRFRRYFPLKLDNIEFSVNAGGSVYDVSAYAWNEQAFADEVQTVNQDVKLVGENVAEMLQIGAENEESLSYILNSTQLQLRKEGDKDAADVFVIAFPEQDSSDSVPYKNSTEDTNGATTESSRLDGLIKAVQENGVDAEAIKSFAQNTGNINEIGRAKLTVDTFGPENPEFNTREAQQTQDGLFVRLDGTSYNPNKNTLNFPKGRRIQDIIEDVIIASEYGRQLVSPRAVDNTGRKKWFRIESETYDIVDVNNETQQGRSAKIYVYRVVPYLVHQSTFAGANQVSPGIPILKNRTPKEYEYIYSGENDSIIDFEIQFNSAFYQAIQFDLASAGQDTVINGQNDGGSNNYQYYSTPRRDTPGAPDTEGRGRDAEPSAPNRQVGQASDTNSSTYSGGQESPATKISRAYNQALINGVDLIQAEMEIIGDPYFISDSGIGNYRASLVGNQTTADETIDYQYSEPYLILNFKTPIDINSQTGRMDFPSIAGEPVRKFSGLYKITELTNAISANKFTQRLKMIRLRYQNQEESSQPETVQESNEAVFSEELQQVLGIDDGLDIPPSLDELNIPTVTESVGNITGEFGGDPTAGTGAQGTPLNNE